MNSILCKAKMKDLNKWVGGYYVYIDDIGTDEESHRIYCGFGMDGEPYWEEIDPDTLRRFTGKCTKIGGFIYEGDIVRFKRNFIHGGSSVEIGVVVYNVRNGGFHISCSDDIFWDFCDVVDIDVVGNAYDDKDLLNGGEDGKQGLSM